MQLPTQPEGISYRPWLLVWAMMSCVAYFTSTAEAVEPVGTPYVYKTVDGRELRLFVVQPEGADEHASRPAVVFFHGGGWVGGPLNQFDRQCKRLASHGIVSVQVEYRLLDRRSNEPPTICIQDAKTAMRWVRGHAAQLGIDPARIAAGGGSAGGHLAAFVGMVDGLDEPTDDLQVSAKANALVLFNPALDNGPEGWGHNRTGERYREFSPAHNISADDPPTLILNGTNDKLVPVETVKRFEAQMRAAGVRCETELFEGQGHGFFNRDKYCEATLKSTVRFFESLGWIERK